MARSSGIGVVAADRPRRRRGGIDRGCGGSTAGCVALLALWHAARGEWDAAHAIAQQQEGDPSHDWVHAHLHRVEGDLGNAGYWYRRAGKPMPKGDLAAERDAIVAALLAQD